MKKMEIKDEDIESPYCDKCGGCGYMDCDGLESFLKNHIEGKTDCKNEAGFLVDIRWLWEEYKK